MYVFVTVSHCYADEFDVDCCFVAEKEVFDKELDIIQLAFDANAFDSDEFYFGTNEFIMFEDFDDFNCGVSVQDCTKEFHDEFINLAGGYVGYNMFEQLVERATEFAEELAKDKED